MKETELARWVQLLRDRMPRRSWMPGFILSALILIPYLWYVSYVIQLDRGPVDFETFVAAGDRLLNGEEVYVENSYYPMPFVLVFAFFGWLPRPVSMALWLLLPVISAWAIAGWRPLVLLYAPVFGHFVGGQSALFGLWGLWGYRRHTEPDSVTGGLWLTAALLKPQLGLVPLAFAGIRWYKALRAQRRIPRQLLAWGLAMLALYVPTLVIVPGWPGRWLSQPRPLFARAMSGFVPRTLLFFVYPGSITYWATLVIIAGLLLIWIWHRAMRKVTLDLAVLWSFVVSPLVHDYDLLQLVPLLETRLLQWAAVLLSIPGWVVILTAYTSDSAWYAFSIIAPGLLLTMLAQMRRGRGRSRPVPQDSITA